MGRDVYLMRLAYGRSSHDPPLARESTSTNRAEQANGVSLPQPRANGAVGASVSSAPDQEPTSDEAVELYTVPAQQYNSRGHPINPQSRAYGRNLRAAANDILSVVGVVERKGSVGHHFRTSPRTNESLSTENSAGTIIEGLTVVGLDLATWWCNCTLLRFLAYPSAVGLTFAELVGRQYNALGPLNFFLIGKLSVYAGFLLGNSGWWGEDGAVLYYFDRLVMAVISSKSTRDGYVRLRPFLSGFLGVCGAVLELPLRLFSCLQILGLAPRNRVLPPFGSLLPFSHESPLSRGGTPLVTLMFLYRSPLSKQVSSLVARTLELPLPTFAVSHQQDDYRHQSLTIDAEGQPDSPPSTWRSLSAYLADNWAAVTARLHGRSNQATEQRAPATGVTPGQPLLPVIPPAEDRSRTTDVQRQPHGYLTVPTAPGDNIVRPLTAILEDIVASDESVNTSTQAPNHDATIRISSIDQVSGVVNLEIGLPEDHPAAAPIVPSDDEEQVSRRTSSTPATRIGATSELALAPVSFFVGLNQLWLTRLAMLPYDVILFRLLALHFGAHPWPGKGGSPNIWRGLFGRGGAFGVYHQMGLRGYADWLSKVGLCLLCEVAIGCGFSFVQCGIVRLVGSRWFGWGKGKDTVTSQ